MSGWRYNWNESMTYEEIQNAINNVIDENAEHQITAKSLNLLLNDMMTFVKENGGNNVVYIKGYDTIEEYIDSDGESATRLVVNKQENLELNKKAYNAIHNAIENKLGISTIVDWSTIDALINNPFANLFYAPLAYGRVFVSENIVDEIDSNLKKYVNTWIYMLVFGHNLGSYISITNDGKIHSDYF